MAAPGFFQCPRRQYLHVQLPQVAPVIQARRAGAHGDSGLTNRSPFVRPLPFARARARGPRWGQHPRRNGHESRFRPLEYLKNGRPAAQQPVPGGPWGSFTRATTSASGRRIAARCALQPGAAPASVCSGARRLSRTSRARPRSVCISTTRRAARRRLAQSTRSAFLARLHRSARASGRTSGGQTVSARFPLAFAQLSRGWSAAALPLRDGIAPVSLWFRSVRAVNRCLPMYRSCSPMVRSCSLLVRWWFGLVRCLFAASPLPPRSLPAARRLPRRYSLDAPGRRPARAGVFAPTCSPGCSIAPPAARPGRACGRFTAGATPCPRTPGGCFSSGSLAWW